jgi:NAD(P)-dependent dehydrogenase (short-subunit alcohol dehydrogenase family)
MTGRDIDWRRPYASLEGKRAVVTGGSRGIGRAVVEALAAVGARVLFTGRNEEALQEVASGIEERGGTAVPVVAHSRSSEDLQRVAHVAAESFGGVDFLVNNVGVNPAIGPLHELDEALFDIVWTTNVKGYLALTQAIVPLMERGSAVVNMSSIGGQDPAPNVGAYSVSKAAINMMTRQMALELGDAGIRVNAVAPGVVRTRFSEAYWQDDGALHQSTPPVGRFGEPDEVAAAVLFLLSDLAGFITGEILLMDGGAALGH